MLQHLSASRALIGGELRGPTTVVWEHGEIIEVRDVTSDERVVDGILSPGFIDTQVNGVGHDRIVDESCDWTRLSHALRSQGVTTWLPTVPTQHPDFYVNGLAHLSQKVTQSLPGLPQALGLHLEGPLLGAKPGAHRSEWFVADEDRVREWQSVRMVTVAPEHPFAQSVVGMLSSAGVVVSIGHTAASREAYDDAVNAGARHATHVFNAMSGIDHVHGGIAAYVLTDDRVTFSVIADLVHVHPSAIHVAWRAAGERMIVVSDQVALENVKNQSTTARLIGASVGIDAALKNLVEACGIPLAEALVMVSERPARVLRLTDRGFLRVGLRADLVLLTEDLSVHTVVCDGFPTSVVAN